MFWVRKIKIKMKLILLFSKYTLQLIKSDNKDDTKDFYFK